MSRFRWSLTILLMLLLAIIGLRIWVTNNRKKPPAARAADSILGDAQADYPNDPFYVIRMNEPAKAKAAQNADQVLANDDQEAFAYFQKKKWRAYSDIGASPDRPNLFLYVEDKTSPFDDIVISVEDCRQIAKLRSIRGLVIGRSAETLSDDCIRAIASLPNLEVLDINSDKLTGAALTAIAANPSIQLLRLWGKGISDAGIKELTGLPKLKSVLIGDATITGAGFAAFEGNRILESLTFENCEKLTDEGGKAIGRLEGLKELFFRNSKGKLTSAGLVNLVTERVPAHFIFDTSLLSDRALSLLVAHGWYYRPAGEQMANFKMPTSAEEITWIDLSNSAIGDDCISALEPFTKLGGLDLSNTKVTDAIAAKLKSIPKLTTLRLNGTKIGDDTLKAAALLPNLNYLGVAKTKVNDLGIADFKKAKPNCTLVWKEEPETSK